MSQKRERTCRGKRRYRDKQEALRSLRYVARNSTRGKIPTRPYYCALCNGYHLTSQDQKT